MKKVIRLTESDLNRIVKRVIQEQAQDPIKLGFVKWGDKGYIIRLPQGSTPQNDSIRIIAKPTGDDSFLVSIAVNGNKKIRGEMKGLTTFKNIESMFGKPFKDMDNKFVSVSGEINGGELAKLVNLLKSLKIDDKNNMFLNESRIVKRVIQEQASVTATKINSNAQSLLSNSSETYNKSIGVKVLPNCFKYSTDIAQSGIFDGEVGQVVDLLDWPMSNDDPKRLLQWIQGNGFPGVMGGEGNYGALKDRVVKVGGLWYPAVEDLRVKYNLDESMGETLGGSVKKLGSVNNEFIKCYQTWINCVNGK